MNDGTTDGQPTVDRPTASVTRAQLQEQLDAVRAELAEARELAESYRLAAKARAEEITELVLLADASPALAQTRELRRLRQLEKRWAVRVVVHSLEPIERPLTRLSRYGSKLAARLGKGELSVAVEAAGVRVDRKRFRPLWSALVHLVRDAIDHGIEPVAERRSCGKSAGGRIVLRASDSEHGWVLEIEDDGRGIDWARIRAIARARGLCHDTDADLARIVLEQGLSTRSGVTATSGRGVGVAAVNDVVKGLGGVLSVSSREGAGTCWRLTFPARPQDPKERRYAAGLTC